MTSSTSSSYDTPFNRLLYAILLLPMINAQSIPRKFATGGNSYVSFCSPDTTQGLLGNPYVHVYEGSSVYSRGIKQLNTVSMIFADLKSADKISTFSYRNGKACTEPLSGTGGLVKQPVVKCRDHNFDFYYLTNYLGSHTNYLPNSFNGKVITKHRINTENVDIANAWGVFEGLRSTYSSRDCASIGTDPVSLGSKYPIGQVAYCQNLGNYFIYNGNSQWKQVNSDSLKAYGYPSVNLPPAPGVGCKFDANGNRVSTCSLADFIQYITDCSSGGYGIVKRQASVVPLIEGIYYKDRASGTYYSWNNAANGLITLSASNYPDELAFASNGNAYEFDSAGYTVLSFKRQLKRALVPTGPQLASLKSDINSVNKPSVGEGLCSTSEISAGLISDCKCVINALTGICSKQLSSNTIVPNCCTFNRYVSQCAHDSVLSPSAKLTGGCPSDLWSGPKSVFSANIRGCPKNLTSAELTIPLAKTGCSVIGEVTSHSV